MLVEWHQEIVFCNELKSGQFTLDELIDKWTFEGVRAQLEMRSDLEIKEKDDIQWKELGIDITLDSLEFNAVIYFRDMKLDYPIDEFPEKWI